MLSAGEDVIFTPLTFRSLTVKNRIFRSNISGRFTKFAAGGVAAIISSYVPVAIYMSACASCHGYKDADRYVFEGAALGKGTPIGVVGTDPGRMDSYTPAFRDRQLAELFAGTPYRFKSYQDRRLRQRAARRAVAARALPPQWLRGDARRSSEGARRASGGVHAGYRRDRRRERGMLAPACDPDEPSPDGFCFDTALPGNGNRGHASGTSLAAAGKADLLAYLKTF